MIHDALLILWEGELPHYEPTSLLQEYEESINQLEKSEKEIFHRILKVSLIHSSIRKFILDNSFETTSFFSKQHPHTQSGLYLQALSDGFDETLDPYRSNLVKLENKILKDESFQLSYILGSLEIFIPLLETLQSIILKIKGRKLYGCQIPNLLYHYAKSGNNMIATSMNRLLFIQHKIFYEQLCRWILYGRIDDNRQEFFIHAMKKTEQSSGSLKVESTIQSDNTKFSKNESSTCVNTTIDYEIDPMMLPSYIPYSLSEKILFVGKSVVLLDSNPIGKPTNLLQSLTNRNNSSRFNIWGGKEREFHEQIKRLKSETTFDVIRLESFIDEVKLCVTEHLWIIAEQEAGVLHELRVMKDYFLLGRGELFLEFLRLGEHILNSPSTPISTRDINLSFRNAARAVLLDKNEDIEKFSFIIPSKKSESQNSGDFSDAWSTMILKYNVKWPLHLIFTPEVLSTYNRIFQFLLKLKKTQQDLHLLWFNHKKTQSNRGSTWQLINKLMFLMDNIQHYMQSDVLESNFSKLKIDSEKVKDFEKLKRIHQHFLNDILNQAFLFVDQSKEEEYHENTSEENNPVMTNLLEILQLCSSFCTDINMMKDRSEEMYTVSGYTKRFEKLVGTLLQLLVALRTQPCGMHLTRLLMRLDYNRWFSNTANLTQSVTYML